jgi:ectoine hydroxylase-related dioxygenase (phytanoyl-CoA dioxygenase family)
MDDDFFYSVLMIASAHALREDVDQYKMNADVSNYFVFAEQEVVMALKPGDMLIFNPKYHHCLSSRTSAYENEDVFSLLLYLKSAIVGKNNNTIPLKKAEIELLEGIINP